MVAKKRTHREYILNLKDREKKLEDKVNSDLEEEGKRFDELVEKAGGERTKNEKQGSKGDGDAR